MSRGSFQQGWFCDSKILSILQIRQSSGGSSMVRGTATRYLRTCTPYRVPAEGHRQNPYKHSKCLCCQAHQQQQSIAWNGGWRVKMLFAEATKPGNLLSKERIFHISDWPKEPRTQRWSKAWFLAIVGKSKADRKRMSCRRVKAPGLF